MAVSVMEGAKRRNISPTTSTLHMLFEDIDCSALAAPPEDGEFIIAKPSGATTVEAGHVGSNANEHALNHLNPPLFRMVWGSAIRSDRSALGDSRVPVLAKGGGRFKTKFFLTEDSDTPSASGYQEGVQLTVLLATHRGANRALLAPCAAAMSGLTASHAVWVVGQVVRVVNDSAVSGTGEIEVLLYSEPRIGYIPS